VGSRTGDPGGIGGFRVLARRGSAFAKTGLPNFVRLALAWTEMAAAILFLIPRATMAGGWFLIAVLVSAIVIHLLHGWLDVGALVVYAAATWAVMAGKKQTT
jgi:hypothetical protein